MQFMQYGMNNIPEEYIDKLCDRASEEARDCRQPCRARARPASLTVALKEVVKLNHKEISVEDFNKMMSE